MLNFLTNGIRNVLGMLDQADAYLGSVEEQLADIAARTEQAELHIVELGERFAAMAGQTSARKPVNRLKAVAGRNGRKATRNGKASRRGATAKK